MQPPRHMTASPRQRQRTSDTLQHCPIFAGIPPRDLFALARNGSERVYGKRQIIVHPEVRRETVVVVEAGEARLFRSSPDGHEVTLARFRRGDVYSIPLLWTGEASASTLEATSDGTVACLLPRRELCAFLDSHPTALRAASQLMAQTASELADTVEDVAFHPVVARVAHVLARQAEEQGTRHILLTHHEVGARAATTQPQVTRALTTLEREGLIQTRRRRPGIEVHEIETLRHYQKSR